MRWFTNHDQRQAERTRLIERLEHEGLRFEQWLVTIATGTVVLSVTFIGNLDAADHRTLLISAWIALVASVFFGLTDRLLFIFSLSSHPLLGPDEAAEARERRWMKYWGLSETMSWLQIVTFFAGILLLLLFAINQL